jgi:hypothetical protein
MGLDMYIFKTKKTDHSAQQLSELNSRAAADNPEFAEFLPLNKPYPESAPDIVSIFKEVAYWRKFNALHQWFVTNVQLGIDDCGLYEVTRDELTQCLELLRETAASGNSNTLPPTQGFFWGSTEVDESYWRMIRSSIDMVYGLIEYTDWNKERLFYQASW